MNEMIAVLIPIKSFNEAKGRLSEILDKSERSTLMQKMAETVISSSGSLSIWIVCDDEEVAEWAESKNVSVIKVDKPGLNNAVKLADIVMPEREIDTFMDEVDKPDEPEEQPEDIAQPEVDLQPTTGIDVNIVVCNTSRIYFSYI